MSRAPAVRVADVAKAFGRGPVVLRVDRLELAGPALVRVEGDNGAGKSTLLRLLAGVAGVIDVAWPVLTGAFDRDPSAGDVSGALAAHLGCAAYGAALGTLASARNVARPGVAFAILVAFAIAAVPLFDLGPVLSPAAWTADALLDGRAVAVPALVLVAHAAAAGALAAWALRRTA